ncbi:MAG: hypothetical protein ACYCO4_08410 [Sulfobacillus sp.]
MSGSHGPAEVTDEVVAAIVAALAACGVDTKPGLARSPHLVIRQDAQMYAQMARQSQMSKRRRGGRS